MKKVLAITTALILAVIMMLPAFAATNPVISTEDADHTYSVYQIFTGEVEDGKLTNVKYGKNSKGTVGTDVPAATLETIAGLAGTDAVVSKAVAEYANLQSEVFGTLTSSSSVTAPAGYYLIKDAASFTNKDDAATLYVIEVVSADVAFAPKSRSTTTMDKKIVGTSSKVDTLEAKKNDLVTFEISVTLPTTLANYEKYKLVINDALSSGLTYQNDAAFYLGEVTTAKKIASGFTKGTGLVWTCDDVKTISGVEAGSTIILRYTAKVTGDQILANNEAFCQYSNNPYVSSELGKTPAKKVYIYSTNLVINKVDEDGEALDGASFKLEKLVDASYVEVSTISSGSTFTWSGITTGTYRITELSAPTGYNKLSEPIIVAVTGSCTDEGVTTYTASGFDFEDGVLSAEVENKEGSVLPETGGMGTVIFTVLGSILVIGAVVVFVSRKKASSVEG